MSGIRERADGIDLNNVDGFGGGNDAPESPAGFFYYIISLFYFNFSIFFGHISADHFGRLIECFVIRVYGNLCQNRADGFENIACKQFRTQGVLDIIADITLAHCGAYAHRGRRIVDINTAELRHGFVDHADLRSVTVCNGKLIIGLHQIGKRLCGYFYGIPLFQRGIAQCLMSKRYNNFLFAHISVHAFLKMRSYAEMFRISGRKISDRTVSVIISNVSLFV